MENTDFVIEHIDKEVQVIADDPSQVTYRPANTDFFIENIDENVISIAHSLNLEPTEVTFRPANTDFFIENIDKNVILIAESLSLTPSEVTYYPANTDFFIENIDKNLISIATSLSLTPYTVTDLRPNTDMFIENIDKNVTLIKGSTNVVVVSGEFINVNLPDGGKVTDFEMQGNATQTGTPTPDAPQPISVVTGENVVKVVGKNLFDKNASPVFISNNAVEFEALDTGIRAKAKTAATSSNIFGVFIIGASSQFLNKTLTIQSVLSASASNTPRIYIGLCNAAGQNRLAKVFLRSTGSASYTHTTESETSPYLCIVIYANSGGAVQVGDYADYTNLQLEVGNQATSYQAYTAQEYLIDLGSTELAKIGSYQDRIYKEGEKWYVEKQVGKVTFDGSEDGWTSEGGGAPYRMPMPDFSRPSPATIFAISDYFESVPYNANWNNYTSLITTNATGSAAAFKFRYTAITSLADWKTWLASNPTTVYYALATPTTTEITEQNLIDQLNAIDATELYLGVNNIIVVTSNAMPTLKFVIDKY